MGTAIDRFDEKARRTFDSIGRTEVYRGELLRHPVYTRVLHWMVALFFFLALFTGFRNLFTVAVPLVHTHLWRRTAEPADASVFRSGVRFFLFSAEC
jgi:hypothetical protein